MEKLLTLKEATDQLLSNPDTSKKLKRKIRKLQKKLHTAEGAALMRGELLKEKIKDAKTNP